MRMPVKHQQLGSFSVDCLESKEVAAKIKVLQFLFDKSILSLNIELPILDRLKK